VMNEANLPLCTHLGTGMGGEQQMAKIDFSKMGEIMQARNDPEKLQQLLADNPDLARMAEGMGVGGTTSRPTPRPASLVLLQLAGQTCLIEWINSGNFMRLGEERDPNVGLQEDGAVFTIPRAPVRRRIHGIETFNVLRGGEYFFMPSLSALRWLGNLDNQEY